MWPAGATSEVTVAGITGSVSLALTNFNGPISMIVDNNGWTDNCAVGGTCIVECTVTSGSPATQLWNPCDLKFDASANLYVSDQANHRVQKFMMKITPKCTAYQGHRTSISLSDVLADTSPDYDSYYGKLRKDKYCYQLVE
ncbi:unnamed protein product [Rotaria magnacalcarata]|uniref:Uncharacterized protein n=1 Tax=Rotaria magnacalcarata TaxID=392030 RepID=A0A814XXU9_9BILA|nr:unnamed protein product [Rotaria magnacalcarata]CAF1686379.1 unnamed protein product [Rotaria magnacalcarata]